jgi:hypothetical protein
MKTFENKTVLITGGASGIGKGIWRESGSGTRALVESVLKDGGVNPRKLDQRFESGSSAAIKSLVIAGLGVGFFSCGKFNRKLLGDSSDRLTFLVFEFSGCSPGTSSGELGGLPGEF